MISLTETISADVTSTENSPEEDISWMCVKSKQRTTIPSSLTRMTLPPKHQELVTFIQSF